MRGTCCRYLIWGLVLLLWAPAPAFSASRALLVGVGDYAHLPAILASGKKADKLAGPPRDLQKMREVLRRYDFAPEDILVLADQQATRTAVLEALSRWLIQGTQPGDTAVFYFSGHGVQVPDLDGDEADGLDEGLALHDFHPQTLAGILIDDDFAKIIRGLEGRHVAVIVDSCYAGGAFRSIGPRVVTFLEPTWTRRSRYIPLVQSVAPPGVFGPQSQPLSLDLPQEVVFWAASREHQEAVEDFFGDGVYGLFTRFLAQVLEQGHGFPYKIVHEQLRQQLLNAGAAQVPILLAEERLKGLPVLNKPGPPPPAAETAEPQVRPPSPPAPSPPSTVAIKPSPIEVLVAVDKISGASSQDRAQLEALLSSFPFVRLVPPGEFADLILRGDKRQGKWNLRFVNSNGDARPLAGHTPAALAESCRRQVVYVHNTKVLARLTNPSPPFRLEAWVTERDRRDFYEGEPVEFQVRSERDASLLILNVDRHGQVHTILPNRSGQDNRIRAGASFRIPDPAALKPEKRVNLVFRPPLGEEMVKVIAVASPEPFDFAALGLLEIPAAGTGKGIAGVVQLNPQALERLLPHPWSEVTFYLRSHSRSGQGVTPPLQRTTRESGESP